MRAEHCLWALVLLALAGQAKGETLAMRCEEEMIAYCDFGVVCSVNADGAVVIERTLFGSVDAAAIPKLTIGILKSLDPGIKAVLFLQQDGRTIRPAFPDFRLVVEGKVYTTELLAHPEPDDRNNPYSIYDLMSDPSAATLNSHPFPTDYEGYCRRVTEVAASEAARRRAELSGILDIISDPNTRKQVRSVNLRNEYMEKLSGVHVDDTAIRNRMASIVLQGYEYQNRSIKNELTRMLIRKSPGSRSLDMVRRQALDPSDTPAKRPALKLLEQIAGVEDIQLLQGIIEKTTDPEQRDVLRMAFDAIGELGTDSLAFDSVERARLRMWLERFRQCRIYSDSPLDALLAVDELVRLGHPESLGVLQLPFPDAESERFEWAADAVRRKSEGRKRSALKIGQPVPQSASVPAQYDPAVHWGDPVEGLQAGISVAGVLERSQPIIVVNLYVRNTASHPLRLLKLKHQALKWEQALPVEVCLAGGPAPYRGPRSAVVPAESGADYVELDAGEVDGVQLEMKTENWRLGPVFDVQLTFMSDGYPAVKDAPMRSAPVRVTVGADSDRTATD